MKVTSNRAICFVGSAVLPLIFYCIWASRTGYWLDAGEFVAAAVDLGITHPPGHPLHTLIAHLFTWLPLGSYAYRVALASAVPCALALGCVSLIMRRGLRRIGISPHASTLIAAGSAWCLGLTAAWSFQGVRPEVYGLQSLLVWACLERSLAAVFAAPTKRVRNLTWAALWCGLGLTNHHFTTVMTAPALLLALPWILRGGMWKKVNLWLRVITAFVVGLLPYIYLPVRASMHPWMNLGDPSSWQRFFWVVSAKAFQKNTGEGVPGTLSERLLDVIAVAFEHLGPFCLALAILGLYLTIRFARTRFFGIFLVGIILPCILARAWLGFTRSNPDAWGYLMPALGALMIASVLGITIIIKSITSALSNRSLKPAMHLSAIIALWGVMLPAMSKGVQQSNLQHFTDTSVIDKHGIQSLPAHAVLIAFLPETVFRAWENRANRTLRHDITVIAMPFLTYPNAVEQLQSDNPQLAALISSLRTNLEQIKPLLTVAKKRPLFVEMDARVPRTWLPYLRPEHIYFRADSQAVTASDMQTAIMAYDRLYETLQGQLGSVPQDAETRKQMLWHAFHDASFFQTIGMVDSAQRTALRGLRIAPLDQDLNKLLTSTKTPALLTD